MATQKEAMLQIVDSVIDFVAEFQTPTKKHEKAVDKFLKKLVKNREKLDAQIRAYQAKRQS